MRWTNPCLRTKTTNTAASNEPKPATKNDAKKDNEDSLADVGGLLKFVPQRR